MTLGGCFVSQVPDWTPAPAPPDCQWLTGKLALCQSTAAKQDELSAIEHDIIWTPQSETDANPIKHSTLHDCT